MPTLAEKFASERQDRIEEIIKELEALKDADTELAHTEADRLLVELAGILAKFLNPFGRELVSRAIEKYNEVPKWYS